LIQCAVEILEECPDIDILLVCCGGGGLLSGCAAAVKLSGSKARVIGVEPEGAPCMYHSLKNDKPMQLQNVNRDVKSTIAHGLAAPYTGPISFEHAKEFVDDIVLVSDDQLIAATRVLYDNGLLAEPSGCAGVAAIMSQKVAGAEGAKVACIVSGSNVKPSELSHLFASQELD